MAKIVIADDEPHIRLLMEQTLEELEDEGVEIISVDNGLDALNTIRKEKPELVFLDIMMPHMNGFEVCKSLKADMDNKSYVILLTAKGQVVDKQKGLECGADLYMTKPFNPDEVVEKALEVLGM